MVVDHIGIVVKSIEKSIEHWENNFGYRQQTEIVKNAKQKVNIVFMVKEDSLDIKLVEPCDSTSSVYGFAKRGGGLHHLCFSCKDLNVNLNRLEKNKVRIICQPETGEAFCNNKIAFLYSQGINIEMIATPLRAHLIEDKNTKKG